MGVAERKEREKEQRRSAIIDAAERIFFSKGTDNATMDEVAKEAELSKGTLYLYFKNKDELLHGIIGRALDVLYSLYKEAAAKEETGFAKINSLGRAYYTFYKQHPNYFETMLHKEFKKPNDDKLEKNPNYARCGEMGDKIFGLMQEAVSIGIADGTIRKDLDPLKLSLVLWGHSNGILQVIAAKGEFLETKYHLKSEDIIEYSYSLIGHYLTNSDTRLPV
ncbi:MAG: TetR/AcrR family transcriptional regulator [bacterium]|nr:TetR/AcrR family transcriptional regulator [bacterium]